MTLISTLLSAPFASIIDEPNRRRRELIEKIQEKTGRKLITYVANLNAPAGNVIDYNDATLVNDILSLLEFPKELDIIIHSGGGLAEATQKLVSMLRDKTASIRFIIPEMAKSAATLLSFAGDEILMSYMSELGPIDPQILMGFDPATKQPVYWPAWSVIHSVDSLEESFKKGMTPQIVGALLQQVNPLLLDVARKAIEYSKTLAKDWLTNYMKLDAVKAGEIADYFADLKTHLSHGRVINYVEAKNRGLKVTKIDENSEMWKLISELHLRTKLFMVPPITKVLDCEKHSYFQQITIAPVK